MNNTALAVRTDINELQTIGQVFVKSGYFQDTRDAAQAIVKVMAGAELGFPAIASMTGVYIVKGNVSLSANLMAAAIKKSGKYNYRVRQLDDKGCKIEFFEGSESVGFSEFTRIDAQNAGLAGSDTYKKFFRNMVFARALSNGAKWYCPDIFGGPIYTPDELGAEVDGETGEVIALPPLGSLAEKAEAMRAARMAAHEPSEMGDASAHLQFTELAEPEPVRDVKLKGAKPTDKPPIMWPNMAGIAGQIFGKCKALGWTPELLANEIYARFKMGVSDTDPVLALEALGGAQLKELDQSLAAEFKAGKAGGRK